VSKLDEGSTFTITFPADTSADTNRKA